VSPPLLVQTKHPAMAFAAPGVRPNAPDHKHATLTHAHRYCGSGQDLTVDHVKPVSKGGLWEWSNLVTACNKCNGKKGSKTLKQLGWKLKKIPSVCNFKDNRCYRPSMLCITAGCSIEGNVVCL